MNIAKIRAQFPILKEQIHGHQLIYFDNAATSQKPQSVLDALMHFYTKQNANVHRGIYTLSEQATYAYESARDAIAAMINAHNATEIVFTHSATHSINMVAHAFVLQMIQSGDEIVITELEHHANLLVWQWVCQQKGARLVYIPVTEDGDIAYDQLDQIITHKTKFVAVSSESNALGTVIDVQRIIEKAHAVGASVLVDASQTVPHQKVDVQQLDADFLVFSGHKMLAPTGIGVLYVHQRIHERLMPFEYGGGMLYATTYQSMQQAKMPYLLEAGTPPVAQAIALKAACAYLDPFLINNQLREYESQLTSRLIDGLHMIHGVRILGPVNKLRGYGHMVSFIIEDVHAHDVAAYLDQFGICVRAGHLCAQPLAQKIGAESMVRASFYLYNTEQEVNRFIDVLSTKNFV